LSGGVRGRVYAFGGVRRTSKRLDGSFPLTLDPSPLGRGKAAGEVVEEVEGGFGADFDFVEVFLAAKVLLVAVELPAGDVLGEEAGMAEFVEFGDDGFVPMAVVEH